MPSRPLLCMLGVLLLMQAYAIGVLARIPGEPIEAYAQGLGVEVRDKDGTIIGRQGLAGGDPFELGLFAMPILVVDAVLLISLFLHQRGLFDARSSVRRILAFDASKKVSILALVSLLAIYAGFSVSEILQEETFTDYEQLRHDVETWPNEEVGIVGASYLLAIDYILFWMSLYVFGNIRLVPFLASIALLFMVYLLTKEMARKRLAGLVAMVVLMQSSTFLAFDTVVSYDNFWVLFYILSIYMILKHRQKVWGRFSPVLYYLSIASKPLAAIFVPASLHFIYKTEFVSKKQKLVAAIPYLAFSAAMPVLVAGRVVVSSFGFDTGLFWDVINGWPVLLALDGFFFVLLLPLIVALYLKVRRGVVLAESIIVFIMLNLWIPPFLTGSIGVANTAYRAVPLLVFFSIGIGMLMANDEARKETGFSKMVSRAVISLALSIIILTLTSAIFPSLIPTIAFAR